jgi:hypothetical protein
MDAVNIAVTAGLAIAGVTILVGGNIMGAFILVIAFIVCKKCE